MRKEAIDKLVTGESNYGKYGKEMPHFLARNEWKETCILSR